MRDRVKVWQLPLTLDELQLQEVLVEFAATQDSFVMGMKRNQNEFRLCLSHVVRALRSCCRNIIKTLISYPDS